MNTNLSSAERWQPCYEQEQTAMATNAAATTTTMTPSSTPRTAAVASGRRSRASRRTAPTTLLNANPSNFRALVQQFTGCSSSSYTARRKGPITLNFASPSSNEEIIHHASDHNNNNNDHNINNNNRCNYDYAMHNYDGQRQAENRVQQDCGYYEQTISYQTDQGVVSAATTGNYVGNVDQDDDMAMLEELVMDDLHSLLR